MPFHAYDEGNLNWLAAFEAESATYSMALRVWPKEVKAGTLGFIDAQKRLRVGYTDAVANFVKLHNLPEPKAILDVGCSVRGAAAVCGGSWGQSSFSGKRTEQCSHKPHTTSPPATFQPQPPLSLSRATLNHRGRSPQVGISTRALSAAFPSAEVTGLDLSAYMLAVASVMDRRGKVRAHAHHSHPRAPTRAPTRTHSRRFWQAAPAAGG